MNLKVGEGCSYHASAFLLEPHLFTLTVSLRLFVGKVNQWKEFFQLMFFYAYVRVKQICSEEGTI